MMYDHGGLDCSIFKNYDSVWSGHFHHRSKRGNVQYLGNPYQMYWNDYKDKRGFHIYDTEKINLGLFRILLRYFKKFITMIWIMIIPILIWMNYKIVL